MPEALAKRGLAHKATADWKNAQTDFEKIIESFPKSPVAELAYEQCALVRGQRKDTEGMITTFKALLEKFPATRAAAEARRQGPHIVMPDDDPDATNFRSF